MQPITVDDFLRAAREAFVNGYHDGRADGLLNMEACEDMRADKYIEELREVARVADLNKADEVNERE